LFDRKENFKKKNPPTEWGKKKGKYRINYKASEKNQRRVIVRLLRKSEGIPIVKTY